MVRCEWPEVLAGLVLLTIAPILLTRLALRRAQGHGPLVRRHTLGLGAAMVCMAGSILLSLRCGALTTDIDTVWNSLWDYNRSDQRQAAVRELRVPRTVVGAVAGACFAVAGAITQGVTRNPLGAPGILGINAGAAFAVVTAIYAIGITTPIGYVWFAFAGAAGAVVVVYSVASDRPRVRQLRRRDLALAGAELQKQAVTIGLPRIGSIQTTRASVGRVRSPHRVGQRLLWPCHEYDRI